MTRAQQDAVVRQEIAKVRTGVEKLKNSQAQMRAALERVGCQDAGECGPGLSDGRCFVCSAIASAS